MAYTIAQIKRANAAAGFNFFDAGAMSFFSSTIHPRVYQGPAGVFLITSEQFVGSDGVAAERKYTLRKFYPETGRVWTYGAFNDLTLREARRRARAVAQA